MELPPPQLLDEDVGGSRSARVIATIVTWTISAFKTRGVHIRTDFKLDRQALRRVGRVVCVHSMRPVLNGAVVMLELFSRLLLLIIFLALSCTPRHRQVVIERMRSSLQMHVHSVRR